MSTWWNSLTLLQRVFACMAVPATLVLVLQTLLSLFGLAGGHDADHEADHDFDHDHDLNQGLDHAAEHGLAHLEQGQELGGGHGAEHEQGGLGLRLLTLRGVVAFLAVYGWGSLAISRAGHPWLAAIVFGLLMGLAAMLLVAVVMKLFVSLQSNGAIELENAVGLEGTVYLRIPPLGRGRGKVNLLLQERYAECDAVTEGEEELATGTEIVVTGLTEDGKLIVARKHTAEGRSYMPGNSTQFNKEEVN